MKLILNILLMAMIAGCQPNKTQSIIPTDKTLHTDQSQISYVDCGQGQITLLFVHGWNINKSYWSLQQEKFCGDYRIVALDLPGFGESKNLTKNYSIASYAEDVKALIEQLDLKNVVLIGHSMGGRIILEVAQENNRVIALLGVDNFKEVNQQMTEELQAEVDGFMEWLNADFANNSSAYADQYLIHSETDSTVRNRIVKDYGNVNPEAAISAIDAYLNYEHQEAERLAKLDLPLFIISSDMSPMDTVGLSNTGLSYSLFEMNKTGHFPMVERPELFNKHLENSLAKLRQALK